MAYVYATRKLELSALLKAYDVKNTENSTNIAY